MRAPRVSAPLVVPEAGDEPLLADLELKVVTPMFGGGVTAGQVDRNHPIRASAIRGHLRFWWRACNAAGFRSVADLARAERLLWGSATREFEDEEEEATWGPGAITVRVARTSDGNEFNRHNDGWRRIHGASDPGPPYALFPFERQTNPRRDPLPGQVDIEFRLQVALAHHAGKRDGHPSREDCKTAAEQALWAWISFGGVGARTRRGCGSLYCVGNGDDSTEPRLDAGVFRPWDDLNAWLVDRFEAYVDPVYRNANDPGIRAIPALTQCRVAYGSPLDRPIPAWGSAVDLLKDFLQGPEIGRNPVVNGRPGQSRWPEVSAARTLLGVSNIGPNGHEYQVVPAHLAGGGDFPRADLGLPRILKVQEGPRIEATLEAAGDKTTRMASPVILKALPMPDGRAVPIAILLTAPHLWDGNVPGIRLRGNGRTVPLTPGSIPESLPYWPFPKHTPPHVGDNDVESARDAFVTFAASRYRWHAWTSEEVIP